MLDHLQRRENTYARIAFSRVDCIIQRNLFKVNNVLKVPTHDQRAASDRRQCDMEGVLKVLKSYFSKGWFVFFIVSLLWYLLANM